MTSMNYYSNNVLSSVRASIRNYGGRAQGSLSLKLVGVCVAAYVVVALLDRSGLVSRGQVILFLGFSYDGVVRHLWIHQFVTAALLHGGIGHLLFNMLALWMLGPDVERQLGRRRYFIFSLTCAASGFAGFILCNWGSGAVAIGYSGVIFGILVAQAFFFPNNIVNIFAIFPLKMKHAVVLFGAIELYLTISPEGGGVANSAHLFGALAAFVYLKLPGVNWRWRQNVNVRSAFSSDAGHQVAVHRNWGQTGPLIAEAMREIASGKYAAARDCLNRSHISWSLRSVVRRTKHLVVLAESFGSNACDNARDKFERQVVVVWNQLVQKELFVVLPPLVNVGMQCGEQIVFLLIDALCNPKLSSMPAAIQQVLETAAVETGTAGVEAIMVKLANISTTPELASRLLIMLPAFKLQQYASGIIKIYGQSGAEDRARLIKRLVTMKYNAAGALCDLLAGTLSRMPSDLRLAHEVQAKVGARELESIASRWAAGGHRGAQTVLQRLYDCTN